MDEETQEALQKTIASLREKLDDAEQLIEAIRSGEVDAFAVQHDNHPKIFTLQSADYVYRVLIENFSEGALNITENGLIVYSNQYFYELLGLSYDKVVSNFIHDFIHPDSADAFRDLFNKAFSGQSKGEICLVAGGKAIPVYVSLTSLYPHLHAVGVIVTDLTGQKQHDKESADKNKFIENLLDASPDLIMVLDRELRFISFNNKAIDQFQFQNSEEGLGKHMKELLPHLTNEKYSISLQLAFDGVEQYLDEHEVLEDGRCYDMYIVPLRDENAVYAVMLTLRDVTEHATNKQKLQTTNSQLQERNAFIETIIEASHELIAVYDEELTLLTLNNASERYTGWSKEQVIGKKLDELYPNAEGSKAKADLQRALKGEFVSNEPFLSDITGKTIRNYITPLRDSTGHVHAALAIAQDVTDIVVSQEALRKSQEHFSLLFTMSPVPKSISRVSDNTIIEVNPAWEKMFRRKRAEAIGKTETELGIERIEPVPHGATDRKKNNAMVPEEEIEFHIKPSRKIYAYIATANLELDGEHCLLCATIDTTQRRKDEDRIKEGIQQLGEQNEKLEQTNAELASFSYIASHDLQEPLRKIQTFCNRILEKEEENFSPLTRSYFERITNAAARMQKLIAALLDYSRTNTTYFDFVPTDLNQIISEIRANLREMIVENKVSLKIDPLPTLSAIPMQLSQLFSNLLINSIKYRRPDVKPVVSIEAEKVAAITLGEEFADNPDQFWRITVKDNGIGFDQQHVDRIFGLFQRLHGKTEYEGTGIGLAICKKIVDNHKGLIKAVGRPGEGSEFQVYLPAGLEHDET